MVLSSADEAKLAVYEMLRRENELTAYGAELMGYPIAIAMCKILYREGVPVPPTELKRKAKDVVDPLRVRDKRPNVTDSELNNEYELLIFRKEIRITEEGCELTDYGRELEDMLAF